MKVELTGWRRIANALWRAPSDPQIYGTLDADARPVLRIVEAARAKGHHLTPTHVVGRAVAHAIAAVPEMNVVLRGGHARARSSVDVFFITAVASGHDLSGVKVERADEKSAIAIAAELGGRAALLKRGEDAGFSSSKRLTDTLPLPVLRVALRAMSYVTNDLQLSVGALHLAASPFGSAMVSSVGMFGIPSGFGPLAWMYGAPLLLLVGEIVDRPVAVDGRVEVHPVLPINATIDHRYVDGWHIGRLVKAFREYLADPMSYEPVLEDRAAAE